MPERSQFPAHASPQLQELVHGAGEWTAFFASFMNIVRKSLRRGAPGLAI